MSNEHKNILMEAMGRLVRDMPVESTLPEKIEGLLAQLRELPAEAQPSLPGSEREPKQK